MKDLTPIQIEYLKAAELMRWAEVGHFTYFFTGQWQRWKRSEYNLPRMVAKGALHCVRFGKKMVYAAAGGRKLTRYPQDIHHGLACTRALLRLKTARPGELLPERIFRDLGTKAVPEWAALYPGKMILFEFSTADNFRRTRLMKSKIKRYQKDLNRFRDYFEAEPIVLFVLEAERWKVKRFAEGTNFYFCDANSFFSADPKKQLDAPIYIWGGDQERYGLTT